MHEPDSSLWLAKPELSDEAAAPLLNFLYELLTGFENAYFDQLHRYHATHEPSAENLPPDEPPELRQRSLLIHLSSATHDSTLITTRHAHQIA